MHHNFHFIADDCFAELVDALGVAADARCPVPGSPLPDAFVIALAKARISKEFSMDVKKLQVLDA